MTDEYIDVDWYVCGVYKGKRKVGKNSICGMFLTGDVSGALNKTSDMTDEINTIPGVTAKVELEAE